MSGTGSRVFPSGPQSVTARNGRAVRGREGDAFMQDTAKVGDRSTSPPANGVREALRFALGDCSPDCPALHAEAYRLARELNHARWAHVIDALNAAPDGGLCVVGAGADGIDK